MLSLHRFLVNLRKFSRREAENLIRIGKVTVNGIKIVRPEYRINPEQDSIAVCGIIEPLKKINFLYYKFYKPKGYVCSRNDEGKKVSIYRIIPSSLQRLHYVGRLDIMSEGLLILTNDGQLTYALTRPEFLVKKVYLVTLHGHLALEKIKEIEKGIVISGQKYLPVSVEIVRQYDDRCVTRWTLYEGKKREIRRMAQFINHQIIELKRIEFGGITIGDLKPGEVKPLCDEELMTLKIISRNSDKKLEKRERICKIKQITRGSIDGNNKSYR